jgi:MFS family permease
MRHISLGFLAFALELILLPHLKGTLSLILFGALDGLTFPLFWIPFNTLYFRMRKGDESAVLAGLAYLGPPLMGIAAPLVSGFIVDTYGIIWVFWIGALILTLSGIFYLRQKSETILISLSSAWTAGKGIKSLVFIQGFWQGVDWLCVPIITLVFLTSGVSYGGFFSVLAVVGAFATLYFCHLSDKSGNRVNYLYPSIVMTAAATVMSAFTLDLVNWVIVRGMVSFFIAVANPFTTSVVLDRVRNTEEAMYLREILLNMGRAFGAFTVIVCQLYLGGLQVAFVPSGILLLFYPVIVEYKKLYKGVVICPPQVEPIEAHD